MNEIIAQPDQIPPQTSLSDAFGLTDRQGAFLTEFLLTGNLVRAAEAVRPDNPESARRMHYFDLQQSEGYRTAHRKIMQTVGSAIVEKMVQRATEGDLVIFKDQIVTDPNTGQPLRKFDTILQIYLSKALAGLSDNGPTGRQGNSGPTINVIMPGNSQPPTIEVQFDSDSEPPITE